MIRRPTLIALALLSLVSQDIAQAQEPQASRSTFSRLLDVQELIDAEQYAEALVKLDELFEKTRDKPYDFALTNQYIAHTCVLADCPDRTRLALENALAQPGLPADMLANLKLSYGQVLLVDEEFEAARNVFEEWLALLAETDSTANPTQLFSAAYANYQTERFDRSAELLGEAITRNPKAPLSWRQLYYHSLYELRRYEEAEAVALDMLPRYLDNKTVWHLLSNHYLRREEGMKALAVMTVAYQQQVLNTPTDLRRIVSLYSAVDVPERAARLMEMLLEKSLADQDFETLKLLGDLWLLSRERDKALLALTDAAKLSEEGMTDELVASIHFEDERWLAAFEAFERSIEKSDDEEIERLHLLAGISAARAGLKAEAREHLKIAMQDEEFRAQAKGVIRDLESG